MFFSLPWLQGSVAKITPAELEQRIASKESPLIIDVRTKAEFAGGHVPGAIPMPLHELVGKMEELDRQTEIVLLCLSGAPSKEAYRIMEANGFSNIRNMSGGMLSWRGSVV